jgi:hypothetical protein
MHEHSLLGSCGAFIRSVASHWSGGARSTASRNAS